jgi:hypothetical protein
MSQLSDDYCFSFFFSLGLSQDLLPPCLGGHQTIRGTCRLS